MQNNIFHFVNLLDTKLSAAADFWAVHKKPAKMKAKIKQIPKTFTSLKARKSG
jgi:hypothetical protein